ncbi:MAG: hypothetical protein Q8O33_12850 [Pseudomonadota bacterium]|nr:hypothetical protein [Pseudomonadota bacterium]
MIDHHKIRRESMRWYVLLTLYNASPVGAYEELILATMQGIYPDATQLEIRQQLDYLSDRALVRVDKQPSGRWFGDLTRCGTDVVEYTVALEPGIARPERY